MSERDDELTPQELHGIQRGIRDVSEGKVRPFKDIRREAAERANNEKIAGLFGEKLCDDPNCPAFGTGHVHGTAAQQERASEIAAAVAAWKDELLHKLDVWAASAEKGAFPDDSKAIKTVKIGVEQMPANAQALSAERARVRLEEAEWWYQWATGITPYQNAVTRNASWREAEARIAALRHGAGEREGTHEDGPPRGLGSP